MKTTRADALIREMLTSGSGLAEAVDALADREAALRESHHSSDISEHELMRDVLTRSGFEPIIDGPTYAEDAVQGIERYKLTGGGSVVEIDMSPDGEFRGKFTHHDAAGSGVRPRTGYGHKQLSDLLRGHD